MYNFQSSNIIDPRRSESTGALVENSKIKIPHKNGNYDLRVIEKIGNGGFGSVYKCVDTVGNGEYALKKIESKKDQGISCLFEASMMSSYKYPSLNKAITINASLDHIYILQDVASYDLRQHISKNSLDMNKRKNILYRICKGISYLHENDLIHGDIKTGNILYYSEDDIRISDFNLTIMKKWKSDIKLCTAIYRPLEVWRSKNFDWNAKIDIWCLGCLMHELLYDNEIIFPFQGKAELKMKK